MESPPETAEAAPAPPKRGWRPEFWVAFLAIFFLAIVLLSVFLTSSNQNLIWLRPADLTAVNHSGPLIQLKNQIKQLILPVWQHFRSNPQIVRLDAKIITVSASDAAQISPGPPGSTSADGMRAWILSPAQLQAFNRQLKTNSGIGSIVSPRIQTASGMQSSMGMTEWVAGKVNKGDTNNGVQVGTTLQLLAKVVSGSVKLRLGAASTSFVGRTPEQLLLIQTNLDMACQVVIPNAGALAVDGGNLKGQNGTNYWLLISPTICDPQGRPLKP